ncbi:CDP-glycerol glycerophosphotransferase family protein [Desulfonatronum sp. SC1]|uniref:CDP-glycerol glycerophosphotransferase family protein n=1 Tax=Desulfonatronum sp. SC1 TaxID=2109626 RepID=UPI001E5821C2|nr:CDP-glycerol glycerophosphotransferase family protein [Desulfonatronum sp. SC1]
MAERVAILPEIIHEYRGRERGSAPSGTQTFSPDRIIQCAGIYRACLEEYQRQNNPTLLALLEERTVIRFMRFFVRSSFFPDADAVYYRELRLLLENINVQLIVRHAENFILPFLMIRAGYFRHAAAVLHSRNNLVAVKDFFSQLEHNDRVCHILYMDALDSCRQGMKCVLNVKPPLKTSPEDKALSRYENHCKEWMRRPYLHDLCLGTYRAGKKVKNTFSRSYAKIAENSWKRIFSTYLRRITLIMLLLFLRILLRCCTKKRVWLVAEREGNGCEENGYVFFKYCLAEKKHTDIYYILNKDVRLPADFPDPARAVRKNTWSYVRLLCLANVFLFTNKEDDICDYPVLRFALPGVQTIFLTHGVTLYGPGVYLRSVANRFDKIIAVSELEKTQKIRDWMIRDPGRIMITGLPRFDELLGQKADREVLFALTWRKRLDRMAPEEFIESFYFRRIRSFLSHPDLDVLLCEQDLRLRVRFHFRMKEHANHFAGFASQRIIIEYSDDAVPLRNVLQQACVLITDYSSIMWDMAYMQRPVLLYQFDIDAFLAERCLHGFSTREEDMRFAAVARDEKQLTTALEELANRDFKLNTEQRQNAVSFFQYRDEKNCERVYRMVQRVTRKT